MTAEAELALLETAYEAILTGGAQEYSLKDRSVTKLDIGWMSQRIDALRAQVQRQTYGMFNAARFRRDD
jgi:hypothetical protein